MPGQGSITIGGEQWQVYLATTSLELAQGLGGLPCIDPGTGMIFDLGWEQTVQVTTEPMLFPIDICFLSEGLTVIDIHRAVPPGCLIASSVPARLFLEVNAGELEHVECGDHASVELLPLEGIPAVDAGWDGTLFSIVQIMIVGAFAVGMVRGTFSDGEPRSQGNNPSKRKARPTREDVTVETWFERDRAHVRIDERRTGKILIEWWDDDVRQLFEDGFFRRGRGFEDSVLDYGEHLGILAVSGNPAGQYKKRIKSAYLTNWQYGGYSYVEEHPTRPERLWVRGVVDYADPDKVIALAEEEGLPHIHLSGGYWEKIGYQGWGQEVSIPEAKIALALAREHFRR